MRNATDRSSYSTEPIATIPDLIKATNGGSTTPEPDPIPTPEPDPFWIGQARINGKLCQVDWLFVLALREASKLLKAEGADVGTLDALIKQANQLSGDVALEKPPGCFPESRFEVEQ